MTDIIVVHGAFGSPEGNWFPWLKKTLEKKNHRVFTPKFPTPEGQTFEAWRSVFHEVRKGCRPENTILIGHSIGSAFVLRMAEEETEDPYQGVIVVAPFVEFLGDPKFDDVNKTFVEHEMRWKLIHKNAKHSLCVAGEDDPYVPRAAAQRVADGMGVPLHLIQKAGHVNAESGYLAFPLLVKLMGEILGEKDEIRCEE